MADYTSNCVHRQRVGEPVVLVPTISKPRGVAVDSDVFVVAGESEIAVHCRSDNTEATSLAISCRSVCIAPDQRHYISGGDNGSLTIPRVSGSQYPPNRRCFRHGGRSAKLHHRPDTRSCTWRWQDPCCCCKQHALLFGCCC